MGFLEARHDWRRKSSSEWLTMSPEPAVKAQAETVTALLQAWGAGDEEAGRRLVPLVYRDLRRRAAGLLRREAPGHTLQPTALVHEAYLRLVGYPGPWQNRSQFFGVASNLMRRILVDHARRRGAAKRDAIRVVFDEAVQPAAEREVDLVRLDEALLELSALDARQMSGQPSWRRPAATTTKRARRSSTCWTPTPRPSAFSRRPRSEQGPRPSHHH
jgi:RNA polymerase sigma factor (TIGR02999 family)